MHNADRAMLISVLSPLPGTSLNCKTTDMELVHHARCACLHPTVHWYTLHIHSEGRQAALTWVAGYMPRWFTHLLMVTH